MLAGCPQLLAAPYDKVVKTLRLPENFEIVNHYDDNGLIRVHLIAFPSCTQNACFKKN